MYDHLVIKIYTRWSQESKRDRKKEDIRPTVTYAAKILHFNTWAHLRMTVYMVEGKQSTYPNLAFMLAKVTECKTLNVSYKPFARLNQT